MPNMKRHVKMEQNNKGKQMKIKAQDVFLMRPNNKRKKNNPLNMTINSWFLAFVSFFPISNPHLVVSK